MHRHRSANHFAAACLALMLAGCSTATDAGRIPISHPSRAYCDNMIAHGRDNYGTKHLRIFVNGYDIARQTLDDSPTVPPSPNLAGHRHAASNLQHQASLLRLLWHMTELTSDPKYQQAARDWLTDWFEHCADARIGAFPWGTHCAYDVVADKPNGNTIEEKFVDFPWEILYEVNPAATLRMIDHMRLSYDEAMNTSFHHRTLDRTEMLQPRPEFNIQGINGNHPYTIAAVVHMKAWAFAYSMTKDPKYLEWVKKAFAIHHGPTDIPPGLITEIANIGRLTEDPPPGNEWRTRSVMVKYGDPYLWGYYMPKIAELLGPEHGDALRASGEAQLARWPQHAWDRRAGKYLANWSIFSKTAGLDPMATTRAAVGGTPGARVTRHASMWGVVASQGHHQLVTAYLAYAGAYRRTGNEAYRKAAEAVHRVGVGDIDAFAKSDDPRYALLMAVYLQATAELYERSRDEEHLRRGRTAREKAMRLFFRDGWFLGKAGTTISSTTCGSDDLALALLRWDLLEQGKPCPIEDCYLFDWGYSFPGN